MTVSETTQIPNKRLIVDVSPIFYSNLISVSNQMKKSGLKIDKETKKLPYVYEKELIFSVVEELKLLKTQFNAEEVILGFDDSTNGYWRKKVYPRYKYKRSQKRDQSEIEWDKAFKTFEKIKKMLMNTSFKLISVPSVEADDIAFVLSEYFQDKGGSTVVSLDGDWRLCLQYDNTQLYKTRKTQKLPGIYETMTKDEVKAKERTMSIFGDKKDGTLHIKAWTQFSPEFLAEYPKFKGKEQDLYHRHHEIEHMYNLKHNFDPKKQAYKHVRFGEKTFNKSKQTLEELLNENPIHKKNYETNKKLSLPCEIPEDIKNKILQEYKNASDQRVPGELYKFFTENNLFELTGSISLL